MIASPHHGHCRTYELAYSSSDKWPKVYIVIHLFVSLPSAILRIARQGPLHISDRLADLLLQDP